MSELFDFLSKLFDLICQLIELSDDYDPSRRKRVFSPGFVMLMVVVAILEIALLSAWYEHR